MAARKGANKNAGRTPIDRKKFKTNMVNKRLGLDQKSPVKKTDARFKIIQKNRTKLVDARDKLAQMAQKKDAREKLLKIRESRVSGKKKLNESIIRPVGSNILMKKDRFGKISLTTNKTAPQPKPQALTLGFAVKKQLGLIGQERGHLQRQVQRKPVTQTHQVARVNRRNAINRNVAYPTSSPMHVDGYSRDISMNEVYSPAPPPVIRRTIHNDIVDLPPPISDYPRTREQNPYYAWADAAAEFRKMKNEYVQKRLDERDLVPRALQWSNFIDLDNIEDVPVSRPIARPSTGVRARLDTLLASRQTHGIFGQDKLKIPAGHRIIVSNLHPAVSQEDITELFADVGELLVARLVRPGTAEVIYKNLIDAEKAVEVYHNRQLDGQPMNCLLVNKRAAPPVPTVNQVVKPVTSTFRLSAASAVKKTVPKSPVSTSKLIPDLSTIHKVLFNRS